MFAFSFYWNLKDVDQKTRLFTQNNNSNVLTQIFETPNSKKSSHLDFFGMCPTLYFCSTLHFCPNIWNPISDI